MGKNNAKMVDLSLFISAGINPKNGLPIKLDGAPTKSSIKMFLRLVDEQDACNRYKWFNIPFNMSSEEIERLLYYRGQLCAFYEKNTEKFYLMPYALDGTIDFYGRFNTVHPVPITTGGDVEDETKEIEAMRNLLSQMKLRCLYDVVLPEELDEDTILNSCVLIHDYTKQISQTIIPRCQVNEGILDVMSDIVPFMRTGLMLGTGIKGIRVDDSDQAKDVMEASRQMIDQAREGKPWIPLTGAIDFQELADGNLSKTEDYLLAMQALDNIRLQGYGLPNGGIFEKKAHILESENAMNQQAIDRVYQDGLSIRQRFCAIFNSVFGTSLWCMPSESVLDTDINGDGLAVDMDLGDNNGEATGGESNGVD